MKPFSRPAAENRKPVRMTYDGTNGREIVEWSRDENTAARFQYRPELPDEPARVLLVDPVPHWVVVEEGRTIALTREGDLELEPVQVAVQEPVRKPFYDDNEE